MSWTTQRPRAVCMILGFALLLAAWSVPASAQRVEEAQPPQAAPEEREPSISSGLNLITLAGSFDYQRSGDTESAQMNWALAYGRVLPGGFAVGGGITTHTDWTDTDETETWGELSIGPRWFVPVGQSRVHPYIAARFGVGFGRDDNPTSFGGGAGLMFLAGSRRRGVGVVGEVLYAAEKYSNHTHHRVMAALGFTLYIR